MARWWTQVIHTVRAWAVVNVHRHRNHVTETVCDHHHGYRVWVATVDLATGR